VGITLEVAVVHERDVAPAVAGGADRLHVLTPGLTTAQLSGMVRESAGTPLYVARSATARPVAELLEVGASGVSLALLDVDLEVDPGALAAEVGGVPWLFTGVDDSLDPRRSWRRLLGLPGLAGVLSAGSPRGLAEGYDELLAVAERDPEVAALLVPTGGLVAEQVPWFVRAGVRAFHLDLQVRPGASRKSYVDAELTRSWRTLLDARS
jgi:copper homeostasis protein